MLYFEVQVSLPIPPARLRVNASSHANSATRRVARSVITWDDLRWLRKLWPGPLVVKGVLTGDDARRAIDGGADGIVHVLRSLLAEADLTMAVDGYPTLKDLTPDTLRRVT